MRSPKHILQTLTSSSAPANIFIKKVTKSNFESSLSDLRIRIKECDFVAIDLEMTGVTSAPWRENFEFDRSDVRYLKLKDSAEKFAVIQVGVCPFRWNPFKGSFTAHPNTFYVFPRREFPRDDSAFEFLCQTTSINFLARHQFDFNAWIHEGISYLSRTQESEALLKLTEYDAELSCSTSEETAEILPKSTADLLFTERMKIRFQEWRDNILRRTNEAPHPTGNHNESRMQFQTVFFKMRPAVMLNRYSSHQLKLIKQALRKNFTDLVYVCGIDENNLLQKFVAYTDSVQDKIALMKEAKIDMQKISEAKIESAVGFRHIIDILSSEKKLVVGHNCLLDVAHIYSKFVGPLPSTMVEFASSVHKSFPYIIDTKHLINTSDAIQHLMKKSSKSLSSAFSLLCPNISSVARRSTFSSTSKSYVEVEVETEDTAETGSSIWNSGAKHEAGYDAFMTGCVFAQSCHHIGIKFETNAPIFHLTKNAILKAYINHLYPSWNSGTVINLSTGIEIPESGYKRKFPTISFPNIVLIWGFDSKIKPKDVQDSLSKAFGKDSLTSVFFLDSTAALVQFRKKECVKDFLVLKDKLERDDNAITVLHPLGRILEGGNTRAASYETYKEICGSSASRVKFADQAEAVGIRWKTKIEVCSDEDPYVSSVWKERIEQERDHGRVSCDDLLRSLLASEQKHMRSA